MKYRNRAKGKIAKAMHEKARKVAKKIREMRMKKK